MVDNNQQQEKSQDFELIELLFGKVDPSTSADLLDKSFEARFQSLVDQIQPYLHFSEKDGFFPHRFLGWFSSVLDTKLNDKLGIKKLHFRFERARTLKVVAETKSKTHVFIFTEDIEAQHSDFPQTCTRNFKFTTGEFKSVMSRDYTSLDERKLQIDVVKILKDKYELVKNKPKSDKDVKSKKLYLYLREDGVLECEAKDLYRNTQTMQIDSGELKGNNAFKDKFFDEIKQFLRSGKDLSDDVRKELSRITSAKGYTLKSDGEDEKINIKVESKKKIVDQPIEPTVKFQEVTKKLGKSIYLEDYIEKLVSSDTRQAKENLEDILNYIKKIHTNLDLQANVYGIKAREADQHGFVAGVFDSFRYRDNTKLCLEQFAGEGYADIVLLVRGPNHAVDSVPTLVELKAGTEGPVDPSDALRQAEDYIKGFRVNKMRILTNADNTIAVRLNLDNGDHFVEDVNKMYSKKEAKEGCSESQSDELAFSELTRKIIRDLKEKKDLTGEEKEDLISKAVSEIKKGIDILADSTIGSKTYVDVEDTFKHFEPINGEITKEERKEKEIVELVCQKGNVQLLEMICQKEKKDAKGINTIDVQYKWNGTFTGYSKLIDLLQYVIDNRCSPEIALCIAEKMYGGAHVLCNGEQYLNSNHAKGIFGYPGSIVKESLKKAIKLGYKDTVSVMLSGDIYHCIRLMKWEVFQGKQEFREAYDIIKETVADVISSWVEDKQFCKDSVQNLLDQGIETDIKKMGKEDLILQLEYLGEKVVNKACITKENLMKELKERGKEKGEVRLRPTVVGALISTLFFKHQDKTMKVVKGESFTLKTIKEEKCEKRKELQELNKKVNSKESINNTALGLIESLNSGNHASNGWFFREVLARVVNENLDKLKAVCAAICKEPMEELLKGEEVHENVIDVLQFFGVGKDFLLEKSIPGNSDDALVRNSQSVVETVSNRSEKSISSSSRQSSADHDPQSSTVPISQGGKSIPSAASKKSCSASNLPSSRVAEKNNEDAMQNNCVQGGNFCYSINVGQGSYYPNIQNDFIGGRMHRSNRWEDVLVGGSRRKIRKSSDGKVPKIIYFKDAHYERYRKELLRRILDYNQLIDSIVIPEEGSNKKMGDLSLDSSLDTSSISMDQSNISMDQSDFDDVIQDYVRGVEMLKEGQESGGKDKIYEAAKQQLPHAMYAYSIIKFKEVMKGSTTNQQELIKEAVKYMNDSGKCFFPLSSFILGMMELYNIETFGSLIQNESKKSWKMHFANVLLATEGGGPGVEAGASKALGCIGVSNPVFFKPTEYLSIMGEKKAIKELGWMLQCVKYELARDMISNKENSDTVQYLLQELSLSGFIDAKFLHAVALLSNELTESNKERKVYNLLKSAGPEHQEAKLLLGVLPLTQGYGFTKNDHFGCLRDYINVTCDGRDLKKIRLKEKISIFVAHEYINHCNSFVPYNEQEAIDILEKNGYASELKKLKEMIREHKTLSGNVLPDVVKVLKNVYSTFRREGNDELYIQQLLSALRELHKKLKVSKVTIQQSEAISHVLQQLNDISSIKRRGLLLLQQLCDTLEEEVSQKLDNALQKEILPLLENLSEMCTKLQTRLPSSFSSINATKPVDRQYSTATTVPNRSESMSDVFVYPSTLSSEVRRFSSPRTATSPELPFVVRAQSTQLDLRTVLPGDDDVFASCELPFIVKCAYGTPDDHEFLNDIFNLAVDHCEKREYDKALPLYYQVLERRKGWLRCDDFNVIMVYHNIALTLYGLNKSDKALEVFNEMLRELGCDSCYSKTVEHNIKVILNQENKRSFMQPEGKQEQVRSYFLESVSNRFQDTSTVDNGKGSYGSSSSASGFDSGFSTFSDRQSISKRDEIAKSGSKLSSLSTRMGQKQSSDSSKQNVPEVTESGKSSIREALCWNESTSESSQLFSRSRLVSGELSAAGMPSSRLSTSMGNLQTEKHAASSGSIGKR